MRFVNNYLIMIQEPIYYFLWEVNNPFPLVNDYNQKASYNFNTYANDYSFLSLLDSTFKSTQPIDKNNILERLVSIYVNSQNVFYGFATLYERYEQWVNHTVNLTSGNPEYVYVTEWSKNYDIQNAVNRMRVDGFETMYFSDQDFNQGFEVEPDDEISDDDSNVFSKSMNSGTNGKLSTDFNDNLKIGEPISINNSISNPPKDISPDDIYYMTWLIECVELDDSGQLYQELYYHSIQDIYDPTAPYVLDQKANDERLLEQIERAWVMEKYPTISSYLMELAIKYVHKQCVRYGTKDISDYFFNWIQHTAELVSASDDSLRTIVLNYDIDNFCRTFKPDRYFLLFLGKDHTYEDVKIKLKAFFSTEAAQSTEPSIGHNSLDSTEFAIQEIATRYDLFINNLDSYGFMKLPKVSSLSQGQRCKLIAKITQEDSPYAVAMLYELGLPDKLKKEYGLNKEKQYALISKVLGVSLRTIKGNFLTVSNPDSKEDTLKYSACYKVDIVREDYKKLLENP